MDKNLISYRNMLFTDYTVKGAIDEYLEAIGELSEALQDNYPTIGYDLKLHKDQFRDEKIIHFTAMKAIVDCVLGLENGHGAKKFLSATRLRTRMSWRDSQTIFCNWVLA